MFSLLLVSDCSGYTLPCIKIHRGASTGHAIICITVMTSDLKALELVDTAGRLGCLPIEA